MKKHITPDQLETLSPKAQQRLEDWFDNTYEYDDDLIHVFIPQEKTENHDGTFKGQWDSEPEFIYPQKYVGKIKNHRGTILPLMDITLMWQFLEDHHVLHPQQSCDELWEVVKAVLEGTTL